MIINMIFALLLTAFFVSCFYLYIYVTHNFSYWRLRNVRGPQPVPIFGNILDVALLRKTQGECLQNIYRAFAEEKYVGMFQLSTPTLLVLDPFMIKQLLAKDFQFFTDRGFTYDEKKEPLTANLVNLEGVRWRIIRQKLTSTFSSGKIKNMMNLLQECSKQLLVYLECTIQEETNKDIEMREFTAKFTTDVIGTCAFGLQFNSMSEESSEFRRMGQKVMQPSIKNAFSKLIRVFCPLLFKILNLRTFPKEVNDFFLSVVTDTIQHRQQQRIKREDFIQMLMEIRTAENNLCNKSFDIELTDGLIAAQAFAFFIAGFETSSTTMSFCLHELALNKSIQDEAYHEIKTVVKKHGKSFTYDSLKELVFLEQILLETMRKYPPVQALSRTCTKSYVIPNTKIELDQGTAVLIPVYALHHDEKYYPDPEVFNPNRFTKENCSQRVSGTFLPFGDGPRICIGMRFAMLEMKLALATFLNTYKVQPCIKTRDPLPLDPAAFILAPKHGIWVNVTPRN